MTSTVAFDARHALHSRHQPPHRFARDHGRHAEENAHVLVAISTPATCLTMYTSHGNSYFASFIPFTLSGEHLSTAAKLTPSLATLCRMTFPRGRPNCPGCPAAHPLNRSIRVTLDQSRGIPPALTGAIRWSSVLDPLPRKARVYIALTTALGAASLVAVRIVTWDSPDFLKYGAFLLVAVASSQHADPRPRHHRNSFAYFPVRAVRHPRADPAGDHGARLPWSRWSSATGTAPRGAASPR